MSHTGHANRGKGLENLVLQACQVYAKRGWGKIQRIETPVFQGRRGQGDGDKWTRGRSTVDFVGVYQGRGVAFDAKQTKIPRFELARIQPHQRAYLADFAAGGGCAFVLIEFVGVREFYAATIAWMDETASAMGRKSIPLGTFRSVAKLGIGVMAIPEGLCGIGCHFGLAVEPHLATGQLDAPRRRRPKFVNRGNA